MNKKVLYSPILTHKCVTITSMSKTIADVEASLKDIADQEAKLSYIKQTLLSELAALKETERADDVNERCSWVLRERYNIQTLIKNAVCDRSNLSLVDENDNFEEWVKANESYYELCEKIARVSDESDSEDNFGFEDSDSENDKIKKTIISAHKKYFYFSLLFNFECTDCDGCFNLSQYSPYLDHGVYKNRAQPKYATLDVSPYRHGSERHCIRHIYDNTDEDFMGMSLFDTVPMGFYEG